MAWAQRGEARLYYRVDGRANAPWLMLCNSLGTTHAMWDPQAKAFGRHFRVLRYDRRGHGRSSTPSGPYTMADLGEDALAVMEAAGAERVHFCGLSIGGQVGQWLALHAAARIERLVLCSTALKIGTADGWAARREAVEAEGLEPVADASIARWFTPAYAGTHAAQTAAVHAQMMQTTVAGYTGCCHALGEADFRETSGAIAAPTLTLAGLGDPVTPPGDLHAISRAVADGRYAAVAGAHLCNIESPSAFNAAVLDFLTTRGAN